MTISFQFAKRLSEMPRYEREGKVWIDDNRLIALIEELFSAWNFGQVSHTYDEEQDVMCWTFNDGSSLTIANGWQHHGKPATYQARA